VSFIYWRGRRVSGRAAEMKKCLAGDRLRIVSVRVRPRAVDAGVQALAGFAGSLVLGPILTVVMKAVFGRKGGSYG
jgi:hypothetical protein